ncbi:M10 family metallopeptidase [Neptunicoccus cionae]|uniref:M10 family metallopeptidase n=1 Tax=Neptunicoccus cionae TaxID=2035344 RepID=UPI000C786161|nr:M10 family metallopeptidase [Amylibacter cionae]PLS22084.1 hypothetical protein C0U40_06510 [Amylibacter cionae]
MAIINETLFGDAPDHNGTPYTLTFGDTFQGSIDYVGDVDYIRVFLEEGQTVSVVGQTPTGTPYNPNALVPHVNLLNGAGTLIDDTDNIGYTNSGLMFTATTTGDYYVSISDYFGSYTGSYEVEIKDANFTTDDIADHLTKGFWQSTNRDTHAFDISSDVVITYNIAALNADGQALALAAMEVWSDVSGLVFSASGGAADIVFTQDRDPSDGSRTAYATYSATGQTTTSSLVNISDNWISYYGTAVGGYGFQTYIHEIGHVLGLGHAGNYNGSAIYSLDGASNHYLNDSWQSTVMSYFDQTENLDVNADKTYIVMPGIADIVAIQNLYGTATPVHNAGDTTYDLDGSNTPFATSGLSQSGNPIMQTLFDTGGTDSFDASLSATYNKFYMESEIFSNVGGYDGNIVIARGTVLENYHGGSDIDEVYGNAVSNTIFGNDGWDDLYGGSGTDHLYGGNHNDYLTGGADADMLFGGADFDYADYVMSSAGVTIRLWNGTGTGGDAEGDILDGIEGILGSGLRDVLIGAAGISNKLFGNGGDDYINGLSGGGAFYGGTGNDHFIGNTGAEEFNGFTDTDHIDYSGSSSGVTVKFWNGTGLNGDADGDTYDAIENATGSAHKDYLIGANAVDNALFGGASDDLLKGLTGDDTLNGGAGADTLEGDGGNDTADYSDSTSRVIIRLWNGTGSLGHAEGDTLSGIEGVIGSNYNDALIGSNSQGDSLSGGNGNDYIDGLGGNDYMGGGYGNDTIIGGLGSDTIDGGAGEDTVDYSAMTGNITVRLWAGTGAGGDSLTNIENAFGGSGNDYLLGSNGVANFLKGNAGTDNIFGLSGDDDLEGGAGADNLYGGSGIDFAMYTGSAAAVTVKLWNGTGSGGDAAGDVLDSIEGVVGSNHNDVLIGSQPLGDTLDGGAGRDFINGLSGDDELFGGSGDDTLVGGTGSDIIVGGSGRDTVDFSSASSGVTVKLWNGTGTSGEAAGDLYYDIENIKGSGYKDYLIGSNEEDNTIIGGAGDDLLNGLRGNDVYDGGSGADIFAFSVDGGQDKILHFEDTIDIVDLTGSLSFSDLSLSSIAGGVRAAVTSSASHYIDLLGVSIADVSSNDFM